MDDVAIKAFKLSLKKAKSCLNQYYKNWKPRFYKRTYKLGKAITPINPKKKHSGHETSIRFGIKYDSSLLNGLYTSNSWYHQSGSEWKSVEQYQTFTQDNGIPDTGWILENYLYGIHPRYVGNPEIGIRNMSIQDETSTHTEMTNFFQQELPGLVGKMVVEEMQDVIKKFFLE